MLISLALRGFNKKKHREAWEQGTLMIPQADFKMQAVPQRWRAAAAEGEVWNDQVVPVKRCKELEARVGLNLDAEPDHKDELMNQCQLVEYDGRDGLILAAIEDAPKTAEEAVRANIRGTMQLKDIKCPICDSLQTIGYAKLRTKTGGFSMIMCKADTCEAVVHSSWPKCRCDIPWVKCPRHVLSQIGCITKRRKAGSSMKLQSGSRHKHLPVM